RLMVTSPAARGTRLTRNVFMRHRSRRRMDLMASHVRFTIAVRRDVPTAAAIALNSVDPSRSPAIRQSSSITTSITRLRLPPRIATGYAAGKAGDDRRITSRTFHDSSFPTNVGSNIETRPIMERGGVTLRKTISERNPRPRNTTDNHCNKHDTLQHGTLA